MVQTTNLSKTLLFQELTQVSGEVALQWFLASHKRQASRKFLGHQVTGFAQFILAGFRGEIFDDKFPSRDTGNGDRAFDNRQYNLEAHY